MADDNNQRPYRSNDPHNRGGTPAGSDPLAELARLIGQSDPFAEFGRDHARRPAVGDQRSGEPSPEWGAQPQDPAYGSGPATGDPHAPPALPGGNEPYYGASATGPLPGTPAYLSGERQLGGGHYPPQFPAAAYGEAPPEGAHQVDPDFENQIPIPGERDDRYDDVPPRRRMGVIAIAAVFALAVLGTAGAVGYRALFGTSGSSPPPVIKADTTPTKVVPAMQSGEAKSNKPIQDRVGDRSQGEKLVSREEQPLEMKDAGKPPSRVVFPALGSSNAASPATASVLPAAPASAGTGSTEPKKIRTVVIHPDQPAVPELAAKPPTLPTPTTLPTRTTATVVPASDDTAAAPTPARTTAPRQVQTPASSGANAPLSLSPDAAPSAPARTAPARAAAAPPRTAPAPQPAQIASAPAAAGGGGYSVQVSSQRSEADAQASFQALQGKFPSMLGDRQPIIRRADLGSKGVFYRTMVGPFASADEANQFCSSLKAAGGQCLIQKQ